MKTALCVLGVLAVICTVAQAAITIETVPVGNPGNANDSTGYGSVGDAYNIGTYEVTAGQYTAFLNAVAATDTYGLYNSSMWSNSYGCKIQRTGSSGSYSYSVASDYANRPVNYVSWGDAARFSNWLNNDQKTILQDANVTEHGAYSLNGATSAAALMAVTRNADAAWFIPTENEWYKAAYHKNDGVTGNYWQHATSSNSTPSNVLGNPTDPGNNATFYSGVFTIGSPYYRTEVGDHENSDSPYGTFDQGGNVWEWDETAVTSSSRGLRGGSFIGSSADMLSSSRSDGFSPTYEGYALGFREASVPEPASILIWSMIGALGIAVGYWRKRRAAQLGST